jgi:hypothetical protein
MTQQSLVSAADVKDRWTILPPLRLKGVGTPLVESIPSYLARLLWTTGVPMNHLARYVGKHSLAGAGHVDSFQHAEALSPIGISRITTLEVLTGEMYLRCGSLWALSEIVACNTSAYGSYRRQWCPRCYEDWDEESYEPLLWRIDLLGVCPKHQCRMECTCPNCGRFQRNIYQQDLRRFCWSCGTSLAEGSTWTSRPAFANWVDNQIVQLIEFCATPRPTPVPLSIYTEFAMGLRINAKNSGRRDTVMRLLLRNIDRHARRNSRRPTLRSLLNMCALQGISVQELLCAPRQVSGPMLVEQWPGMSYLPLPSAVQAQKIYAASKYLEDFLALDPPFVPPMNILLSRFHIQLRALRDVAVDLFDTYEERYLRQGGPIRRARLRGALLCARKVLAQRVRRGGSIFGRQVKKIAGLTEVSLQDATTVLKTAQLMQEAEVAERIEKYCAQLPLRSALNWFLERRRFS